MREDVQILKGLAVPFIISTLVIVGIAYAGRRATDTRRLRNYPASEKVQASRRQSGRSPSTFPKAF